MEMFEGVAIQDPLLLTKQESTKYQITRVLPRIMTPQRHISCVRVVAASILLCLLSSTFSPVVAAKESWDEDGWLRTALAQERLDSGDEFGCYGMPNLEWTADPGAVALECQQYISERVVASQWGDNPISTFTPSGLTMSQHTTVASQGFAVHGDQTGLSSSAWHSSTDVPEDDWDWYNLGRRGGSLEQIIGSKEQVQTAVEEGGLVNLYWIGRMNDATIRHDADIASYLTDEAQAWMTTWGEAWSYWTVQDCYEFSHSSETIDNQTIIEFELLQTEQCTAVSPLAWNVPTTWIFDLQGGEVVEVRDSESVLSDLEGVKKTAEGYTQASSEYLHLSLTKGHNVSIVVNGTVDYDILGHSQFWNNYSTAVTIASHDTTDLFKWSKRFSDEPQLTFTWLVQPRDGIGESGWLAFLSVVVAATTITAMMYILKREGLGPFAEKLPQRSSEFEEESPESKFNAE